MKREETAEFLSEATWVFAFFVASDRILLSLFSFNRYNVKPVHFFKNERGWVYNSGARGELSK